jgi:molybdate transport system substrate-binding protein
MIGRTTRGHVIVAAIGFALWSAPAPTDSQTVRTEITLRSANVFTGVLDGLVKEFEAATGTRVTLVYGTAGEIRRQIAAGEPCEVTILPRPMMDDVVRAEHVERGTVVNLARSAVGVAVRAGAPKPDLSSVDAFRRALLTAQSISYPDPARGGATGILVAHLLQQLGITNEIGPKTRFPPAGQFAVDVVARGEADLAISQPMEVFGKTGVELVGILPPTLQDPPNFVFAAGVHAATRQQQSARALLRFLTGPKAVSAFRSRGMSPG